MNNRFLIRQTLILISLWVHLPKPTQQGRCVRALAGKQCSDIYSMLQQSPNRRTSTSNGRRGTPVCFLQRLRFMNRCSDLLFEEQYEPDCTGECLDFLNKISKLLRKSLFFCDCKDNPDCIWFQQRSHRCMNQTLKYKKNCDLQRQSCEGDSGCVKLYANWFQHCQDMFNGYKCTRKCVRAEQELYAHPIGKTLETCECAGSKTQDKFCRSVRQRRAKLCADVELTGEVDENEYKKDTNKGEQHSYTFVTQRSSSSSALSSGQSLFYGHLIFFTAVVSLEVFADMV